MSILPASMILLVIGLAYALLLKRKLVETLFLSAVTIIGILYIFGLINVQGCLLYGIYFIVAFACACLVYVIFRWKNNKSAVKETASVQGLLIYSILVAFTLFINWNMVFHNWDEFSHWGIVVKSFYSVDAFATTLTGKNAIMFPQYFPGVSLFQYFFSKFDPVFREHYAYIAKNILYFLLFMPFIGEIFNKAKIRRAFLLLAIFIVIPLLRDSFYSNLSVDELLGALFGFALIYYFVYQYENSIFGILMVASAVFMLVLTKDIGLILALGIIGIIVLDLIFHRRTKIHDFLASRKSIYSKTRSMILLVSPALAAFAVKVTWASLLLRSGLRADGFWNTPSLHDVVLLATKQVELYQKQTAVNLISAVFNRKILPIPLSTFAFCIVFLIIATAVARYARKIIAFRRSMLSALVLAIGAGLYQVILMVMYAFSFSEYEAVRLASYERYTMTYLLGMIFFLMTFLIIDDGTHKVTEPFRHTFQALRGKIATNDAILYKEIPMYGRIAKRIFGFLMCLVVVVVLSSWSRPGIKRVVLGRILTSAYSYQFDERKTSAINKWKPYFNDENPYIIAQGDNGILAFMLNYELKPRNVAHNDGYVYSFRPVRPLDSTEEDDMYNLTMTPDEWQGYLLALKTKIVYICKLDEKFIDSYGRFFPEGVEEDMLYGVHTDNGNMKLLPVLQEK